ncbi:hypothetical protein [Niveispirillum sp. SYP-B3756]|uniref:hypothetical protein n=1 Tax=Niveispirillum sp. SYP-B3756 TaxID=2662178 RepID=UPI001B3BC4BE|nr:hypothetical protein [Niveispirillum sp. SYP-B3756]
MRLLLLIALLCLSPLLPAKAQSLDLTHATLVAAPASGPEQAAVTLLLEEVAKRTGIAWEQRAAEAGPLVVVGQGTQMGALLPADLRSAWTAPVGWGREGYTLRTFTYQGRPLIAIAGHDARGVLYGIGHLLRSLAMEKGRAVLAAPLNVTATPEKTLRSHQIGYRFKNNTYDAWTLAQFEQEIRDLAVFGSNAIQVIAPISDDEKASPLFSAPADETIIGIAGILAKYGLDFDLYYPVIRADYGDPAQVAAELADFEALIQRFPAIHALYVPGGDPGHTPPDHLFPLLEKLAARLHRHHPNAELWVSTQGFDQAGYEAFYHQLDRQPAWLTGIFIGPQSRDPMAVQRARIPARYPIQAYPDIGHTLHAQFPVADWDPAFALLEGREPISPRPGDMGVIYRHFQPLFTGFVTYSEGVTDDVNKMLWSQWGWSAATDPAEILRDYARYFLGPAIAQTHADRAAALILNLERNWRGPVRQNTGIGATLQGFLALDQGVAPGNWRWESLLYRAHYDAYARRRAIAEAAREAQATSVLRRAPQLGSHAAVADARAVLATVDDEQTMALRAQVFQLAGRLYHHVGLQLSVRLYGASNWERGANLDRIDTSLNNRRWLEKQFGMIAILPDEAARLQQLAALVNWEQPVPGALYDDLGDPTRSPHLVRGPGMARDPQFFQTAIHSIADVIPGPDWRLSWVTYGETLYDSPLTLHYRGLDPGQSYRLRVTYAGEDYHLPIQLMANKNIEIQQSFSRPANPAMVEYKLPQEAIHDGNLVLQWFRPVGLGGSGRGKQIAEVWLLPVISNNYN